MNSIPDNWQEVKLGDFSPFIYGKALLQKNRKEGGIPVFGSNGIIGYHNKALTEDTGIIIGRKGSIGEIHLSKTPFYPIDTTFYVENIKNKRNLIFTYYLLKTLNLKNLGSDSAVPGLNRNNAHAVVVNIPPIDEQERIAGVLSGFDDKIELLREQNKTLEDMAKTIFKSWFVDFDIVKAKEQGKSKQDIINEFKITEEIYDLFPSSFQDSPLGKIPTTWEVKTIGDFCNIFTGKKDVNQTDEKGSYIFFSCSPKSFRSNDFLYDGKAVIIAGNGSYTGRVNFFNGKFDLYQRTYACVKKEEDYMEFIYTLMKTQFEPSFMGGTRGSSIPYIVKGDITEYNFVFQKEIIKFFCNKVISLMEKQKINDEEIQTLTELRDSLLPKLITGEIRV